MHDPSCGTYKQNNFTYQAAFFKDDTESPSGAATCISLVSSPEEATMITYWTTHMANACISTCMDLKGMNSSYTEGNLKTATLTANTKLFSCLSALKKRLKIKYPKNPKPTNQPTTKPKRGP